MDDVTERGKLTGSILFFGSDTLEKISAKGCSNVGTNLARINADK